MKRHYSESIGLNGARRRMPTTCPVALFALAATWCLRSLARLLWRVGTAVIVAGTVFGLAVIVAERSGALREKIAAAPDVIFSAIVGAPVPPRG